MTGPEGLLRPALEKRFAALYDLALDVSHHENDFEFSIGSDKVIHYVFDENIFELFVNPLKNASYFSRDVDFYPITRSPDGRQIMAAQSALIGAEILFGGALPGQKRGGPIYLSDWHRWELLSRLNELVAQYSRQDMTLLRTEAPEYLRKKLAILGGITSESVGEVEDALDPYLAEDSDALRRVANPGSAQQVAFRRNRIASAMIALNQTIEPLNQLNRLLGRPIQDRLRGLVTLRRPTGDEIETVGRAAASWKRAIREEVEFKGVGREELGISNDANTMALLEWISGKLSPAKERIVFVTGDRTLHDAYRRRLEADPERRKGGVGPFLLRRPIQYSPLFSSAVGDDRLDPHSQLFYSVQQAVELPIVSMHIAAIADRKLDDAALTRRYSLTLSPVAPKGQVHRPYIHEIWRTFGAEYDALSIQQSESDLDRFERILCGFSGEVIAARVSQQERDLLVKAQEGGAVDQKAIFETYVARAIEQLMSSAIAVWRPLAEKVLNEAIERGFEERRRRVPMAVHLALGEDAISVDLFALLNNLQRVGWAEGSNLSSQLRSPFDIFFVSAAVALLTNQWRHADHFCEVAINAAGFSIADSTPVGATAEAYYLGAVTKRFRLGSVIATENLDNFHVARELHNRSLELLRESVDLLKKDVSKTNRAFRDFVAYRASSERAAVNMFFAAYCYQQAELLEGATDAVALTKQAGEEAFAAMRQALVACVRLQHRPQFGRLSPRLDGNGRELLRAQVLINIATWFALTPFFAASPNSKEAQLLARDLDRSVNELVENMDEASRKQFRVEILAFKIVRGVDVEANRTLIQETLGWGSKEESSD